MFGKQRLEQRRTNGGSDFLAGFQIIEEL